MSHLELTRLMDRHPDGAIWYATTAGFMQVKDETLIEIDLEEEARKLASVFGSVKQLVFKPLTDRTSRKRLGACIAWRTQSTPVFTDSVDLRSMNAFMHVIECELARFDASHVAKQKTTFVSNVSHELRTPLHGVLGAVQLLTESGLDPMQKSLADIITTCGATLHETLTSVLSYAKINQFERRQHEYRQRHPPDTVWALTDKDGLASGPDRDYEGLYICTNLAMLCEEILGVLEAGKSFHSPHAGEVTVVCNVEHEQNWTYHTEPGAFRRIAVNLIGNALKYTKSGSIVVTLSADRMIKDGHRVSNDLTSGRTLTLTIEDTGRGMSKDFMDNQLFVPFSQEDPTSTHGVGLGMSIVKSLVSLLSGEIEVRSEEGKGTKMSVKIPMRLCAPGNCEKGEASTKFDQDVQTIRERGFSVVVYGFPQYVRESLTNYLRDWFECKLLEPTLDARPDIVLVDEGNGDILDAVKRTSKVYGRRGVLLSIVMVPSRLGKKMDTIDGYIKWERVPRPLGPTNVANSLLSCLEKLDDLRRHGENATIDEEATEGGSQQRKASVNLQELQKILPNDGYMPSLGNLQISEAPQSSSPPPKAAKPRNVPFKQTLTENQPGKMEKPSMKSEERRIASTADSTLDLRILIVDDNALNLRLLWAFFKKKGYRNVSQAMDGQQAVEAVQNSDDGVDIIFMDLSMPVMDGFEATRQIRKMESDNHRAPTVKDSVIIALTGLASQEDEDGAFDAGVDLFLTKPVQFPKLSKLLHQYQEGTLQRHDRAA
ncbi:hypothetical protein E8E13_002486 [Curvularia kusanoi]|uniref:histidine kinase n=1 Tax=Curvularia kusanoi TaxID=90978 RepID=A0A9P4T8J6_CURKU|nr:hypothetical protein E8E13_002486 [Curvularia kusanoi]